MSNLSLLSSLEEQSLELQLEIEHLEMLLIEMNEKRSALYEKKYDLANSLAIGITKFRYQFCVEEINLMKTQINFLTDEISVKTAQSDETVKQIQHINAIKQSGVCANGKNCKNDLCRFQHAKTNSFVCGEYFACKNPDCSLSHPAKIHVVCNNISTCRFGDKCRFIHSV